MTYWLARMPFYSAFLFAVILCMTSVTFCARQLWSQPDKLDITGYPFSEINSNNNINDNDNINDDNISERESTVS